MLLASDGPGLSGHASVEAEGPGAVRPDQRDDIAPDLAARRSGVDGTTQPTAGRLGELLLPGSCQQGVPRRGRPRDVAAPPVAVREAQGVERRVFTVPGPVPDRASRPGATAFAQAPLPDCGVSP